MKKRRFFPFAVILSFLVLISCAHQKIFFGIAIENVGNPIFGYYEDGRFIPFKLREDHREYSQDVRSFIALFAVNEVFKGVMADGREIRVQIKTKKDCLAGLGDNFFQVESWQGGQRVSPRTTILFWTPNSRVKFLNSIDVRLDEAALQQIWSQTQALWKEALEELPIDDEARTLSKIEYLSPIIQQAQRVPQVVTVLVPALIKRPRTSVKEELKHEFEHVDDRASFFFIYSVSERKIVFGSFGHPEWSPYATKVFTIKPLIYFRIVGDSSVYFLGEHSLAWEHIGYAIFDLKSGNVLIRSY